LESVGLAMISVLLSLVQRYIAKASRTVAEQVRQGRRERNVLST
jgi:hypothetical protein